MNDHKRKIMLTTLFILLASSMLYAIFIPMVSADPIGPIIVSNTTDIPTTQPAASITTAGGSFTTLILNATTQTMRWKAYVGNVSGSFKLQDGANFSIYDWGITSIGGEVYASRNNSINWPNIQCVDNATITNEQTQLNMTTTKEDSINRTFNKTIHKSFYVGTKLITNSSCRAIATYVNGTKQAATEAASFQEILLQDNQKMVYTTIIENKARSYNNGSLDFQMIVAESDINPTPSTYYFWVELS